MHSITENAGPSKQLDAAPKATLPTDHQSRQVSLSECPNPGDGVHSWIMRAAWEAKHAGCSVEEAKTLIAAKISRQPRPGEIEGAVSKAYHADAQASYAPSIKESFSPDALTRVSLSLDGFGRTELLERSPVDPNSCTPAKFLMHLFKPGERVFLCSDLYAREGIIWERDQDDNSHDPHALDALIHPQEGNGAWFLSNPVLGEWQFVERLISASNPKGMTHRGEESLTDCRYLVLESDQASIELWIPILAQLPLPVVSITTSGGRSIHAMIQVNATNPKDWQAIRQKIAPALVTLGGDNGALTLVRLSRLPYCYRKSEEQWQELLYLNPGANETPISKLPVLSESERTANTDVASQGAVHGKLDLQPFEDFARINGLPSGQAVGASSGNDKAELPTKKRSTIYYMKDGGGYLWEQCSGQVVSASEATAKRVLKQESDFKKLSVEDVEKKLYDIQTVQALDYAGSLPGYRKGPHLENGLMLYCMHAPEMPVEFPTEGAPFGSSWPVIQELMRRLFVTGGNEEQFWTVLAHLKAAQETLCGLLNPQATHAKRSVQPGQAMALVGPTDSGKSLFVAQVVVPLLGGRIVDAFKAFTADSSGFNGELLNGEIWLIDDQEHSTDIRTRRKLAAHLKSKLFGAGVAFHPKHKTPITVTPFGRLFICCNSTPENLTVLPPITEDISDKIHLILCNKAEMPMPTTSEENKRLFREQIAREIPHLAGELKRWSIPDKFRSERTGVLTYINPWIESQLRKQSPEAQLAEMIIAAMNSGVIDRDLWEGTSRELKDTLTDDDCIARRDAINLLGGWNAATGTYLGRLAANREEYVREFGLEVTEIGARGGIERYSVKNTIPGRHLEPMLQRIVGG